MRNCDTNLPHCGKKYHTVAGLAFALTTQPMYENAMIGIINAQAVAILDDFTIVGRYSASLQVFDRLLLPSW
jgi:hypothetical protein